MEKNLQIYLTINGIDNYSKPISDAQKATNNFTAEHNKATEKRSQQNNAEKHSVTNVSKAYSNLKKIALSFVGASTLKKAFSEFADQDKYIKKTQGLLHANNIEMQNYADNIKDYAKTSLNSINDLLQVGFIGAKAGFQTKELNDFVKQVDMIQTAVSTSSAETAQAVAENFGIAAKSFNKQPIASLANEYARLIDTTQNLNLHEMGMGLQKLNMVANSTGASFKAITPAIASLIGVGMSGARASTQIFGIAKAFEKFGNKRIAQMLGLKEASLEGEGFITLLNNINNKFGNMQEFQRNKILGKIFGQDTAITISQLLKQMDSINSKVMDLQTNAQGFTERMNAIQKEGAYGTLKQISAQMSVAFSELGQAINQSGIPSIILMLTKLITKTTEGINYVSKFVSAIRGVGNLGYELGKVQINKILQPESEVNIQSQKNIELALQNIKMSLNLPDLRKEQNALDNVTNKNEINISLTNKSNVPLKVEKTESKTLEKPILVKQNILNR
jgi:TP901 family phage tail tape measure protein